MFAEIKFKKLPRNPFPWTHVVQKNYPHFYICAWNVPLDKVKGLSWVLHRVEMDSRLEPRVSQVFGGAILQQNREMECSPESLAGEPPSVDLKIGLTFQRWPFSAYMSSFTAQMVKNPPAVQVTRIWSLSWEDPLEKGMATHSSIFAWRLPWTEEPGGLGPWSRKELDTTERLTLLLCFIFYRAVLLAHPLAKNLWGLVKMKVHYMTSLMCALLYHRWKKSPSFRVGCNVAYKWVEGSAGIQY